MMALIENKQTNEYVRSGAMDAMVSLVSTGQRTRDEVMAYFSSYFRSWSGGRGRQQKKHLQCRVLKPILQDWNL